MYGKKVVILIKLLQKQSTSKITFCLGILCVPAKITVIAWACQV